MLLKKIYIIDGNYFKVYRGKLDILPELADRKKSNGISFLEGYKAKETETQEEH